MQLTSKKNSSKPSVSSNDVSQHRYERQPSKKVAPERIEYVVEGILTPGKAVQGTLIRGWIDETEDSELTNTLWIRLNNGEVLALDKVKVFSSESCRNSYQTSSFFGMPKKLLPQA